MIILMFELSSKFQKFGVLELQKIKKSLKNFKNQIHLWAKETLGILQFIFLFHGSQLKRT